MRIGDFARLARVSVRAVRFYDQTGLLRAASIDQDSGYRQYDIRQLERLRQIRALQDLGFSLRDVQELLRSDLPKSAVRARMQERKSELQRQIRDDASRLERIEKYLRDIGSHEVHPVITLQKAKESWVVSLRAKLRDYDEADEMFVELERKVPARLLRGQRSALWHSCEATASHIDCEVVRFLKTPITAPRDLNVYRLPAAMVASILHCEGEDSIAQSYAALSEWLAGSDFRLQGAKREVYWSDSHSNCTSQSVTEIQFPIARVASKRHQAA
jgi:DNA-binding transcriptional MerR regulator